MKVFIYAYEQNYGGLHGINDMCVCDVDSLNEIDEIGSCMAQEVADSYSYLFDDDVSLCWEAYKIKDNVALSINELDKICNELGYKLFIEEYCDNDNLV